MKNVSFKRMMLFSRLLLNNACAYSFLKGAGVMAAVILFCIIKPILTEGNDMQAMMTTSEDLLKVLFIVPLPLFQAAAIGISKPVPGLMIPASLIEKYISVYFCAFIAAVIGMAGSILIGAGMYGIAGHVIAPAETAGLRPLFFRDTDGLLIDIPLLCLAATVFQLIWPTLLMRRKTGKPVIAVIVCGYILLIFIPAFLMFVGFIGKDAARFSTAIILCLLTILNILWGYLLMKHFEFDRSVNE